MKYKLLLFTLLIFSSYSVYAERCKDYMVLDGSEALSTFGIDTTGHWWAVTQPYTNSYRLIIDGRPSKPYYQLKNLKFSADGEKWAFFGNNNTGWELVINDTVHLLAANDVKDIVFSGNSQVLAYTYTDAGNDYIWLNGNRIRTYQKTGDLYISYDGSKYAYISQRSSNYLVNINGKETSLFEQIIPIGFWHDGSFIYAASYGDRWEIYKNEKPITETYVNIKSTVINLTGTSLAALVKQSSGFWTSVYYSDDYTEPLLGKNYDDVDNLTMNGNSDLFAYSAVYNQNHFVVLSSAEYPAFEETSAPCFTYDGSELYFLSCRISCGLNVNGQLINLPGTLDTSYYVVKKPGTHTLAYSTSSTMVVMDYSAPDMYAGTIVDATITPIYNWRTNLYETLGQIGNRLYLMTGRP